MAQGGALTGAIAIAMMTGAGGCASGKLDDRGSGSQTSGPNLAVTTSGGDAGPDTGTVDTTGREDDTGPPPPPPSDTTGDMCEIGSEGCPCTAGGSCDPGLMCDVDECVPTVVMCGDGVVGGSEECDDGPANSDSGNCKSDCTLQVCGDGAVGPGEACDDGNMVDDDSCTNACALATCGDGQVQQGEACDDGNQVDTDACLSTCVAASCGDTIVQVGVEDCDDGNANDADDCLSSCSAATCGDGAVWADMEECDDADADDADGCTADCLCRLTFEAGSHTSGWTLTGGWGIYSEAPMSTLASVPFTTQGQVFGTDGNRVMPYPGAEVEMSSATTTTFLIPETIRFRSWNVDEGGLSYDNKRVLVSIDGGMSFTPLVDCALGPGASQPFCTAVLAARAEDDWDDIEIDAAAFSGVQGLLRFEYATGDSCCSTEQGWYIDELSAVDCP